MDNDSKKITFIIGDIMIYTDKFYHGKKVSHSFFEGWYFKHKKDNKVISIIPGISINSKGEKIAFIQIISNEFSNYIDFKFEDFSVDENSHKIFIGKNTFSEKGIILNIKTKNLTLEGNLSYSHLRKLNKTIFAPSIMGPFSYLPFMECNHGILSLYHEISGHLFYNEECIYFNGDIGYIEKDWGRSFPKSWTWFQCSEFSQNKKATMMLSIAKIPFLVGEFLGIIFVLDDGHYQIRLATYYGAKLFKKTSDDKITKISIKQRKYMLNIEVYLEKPHILKAPFLGKMGREILEIPSCSCTVKLLKGNDIIFEDNGINAGFENM